MTLVISIQSQVVMGHVGNSAAVFPLLAAGLEVAAVPTVVFSNTPDYPTLRGRAMPADFFAELLQGLWERGLPERADVLLTGYIGSVEVARLVADFVARAKAVNPRLRYFCDPVMGDGGPIDVPQGAELTISADGTITALTPGDAPNTASPIGQLKLVKATAQEVERGDDGLFRLTQQAQATRGAVANADPSIKVMPGVLEGSNVKPVEAMTDMIANSRRFEMQMKVISNVDDNEQRANQLLSMTS